jgi:hypothetical protein
VVFVRAIDVVSSSQDAEHEYGFELVTPTRIFQLAAESEEEMAKWLLGTLGAIATAAK